MKVTKKIVDKDTIWERTIWYDERGEIHREDGPAIIFKDGSKEWWYLNGIRRSEEKYNQVMYKRNLKKLNNTI